MCVFLPKFDKKGEFDIGFHGTGIFLPSKYLSLRHQQEKQAMAIHVSDISWI